MSRPEHLAPPDVFYNEDEARKYTCNSRIIEIQTKMCERALELLLLPENEPCLLLDIGCGSGLSGEVLEEHGHTWIGIDISRAMLDIAKKREVEGDVLLSDMGQGLPFRAGQFDGVVSISALQWLCNLDNSRHGLRKRLDVFFSSLFACLRNGARAVFQFYPENDDQLNLLESAACKAGFSGGRMIDFPNSKKARKVFLVLMTGGVTTVPVDSLAQQNRCTVGKNMKNKNGKKDPLRGTRRDWIMKKKDRFRNKNKEVKADSKYTGRKRSRF
nr:18S rRNA (guanine-N(7))-methyltransferase [Trichogramma dendrolimi]